MKRFFFLLVLLLTLAGPLLVHADFDDVSRWTTFDIDTNNIGAEQVGFAGIIFDGTYIYFPGSRSSGGAPHGEIVRYNTTLSFANPASWEAYDPGGDTVGTDPDGFRGGTFDGRYVYFYPYNTNTTGASGEILRYDTQAQFDLNTSWEAYDTEAQNSRAEGYHGAIFDGRYIYGVPWRNEEDTFNSVVSRFDTQDPDGFTDSGSWTYYDHGISDGFDKGIFDGRYIYFFPFDDGAANTNVVRYDTQGTFNSAGSWTGFDTTTLGSGVQGFRGGTFDGRYIYFAPAVNGSGTHGNVVRYDTTAAFASVDSWNVFDAAVVGTATDGGYNGAVYDGRYVIFTPGDNSFTGEFLRYDTESGVGFTNAASWTSYDPQGGTSVGYFGSDWDGDYVYTSPYSNGGSFFGNVQRFETEAGKDLVAHVLLSNSATSAANVQYTTTFIPLVPLTNNSTVVITFPEVYNTEFDLLGVGDVSIAATGIASATETFDYDTNSITFVLTTTNSGANEVVSPVTITVGDGAVGGLNDLTNPATRGIYGIGLDVLLPNDGLVFQDVALANVQSMVTIQAIVTEALILTLDASGISLVVDPAVNNGQDVSEKTVLSVASNAASGYTLQSRLDDGSGNARLVDDNGNVIDANIAAADNYIGYTARNDGTGAAALAEQDFTASSSNILDDNSDAVGLGVPTDSQQHTVNYDLNVNFLTPAGVYTGTVYYTVIANF